MGFVIEVSMQDSELIFRPVPNPRRKACPISESEMKNPLAQKAGLELCSVRNDRIAYSPQQRGRKRK